MTERCAICGCKLHRTKGTYAQPSAKGRSHASKHHYVAKRFFGRSRNRPGSQRGKIFRKCPWGVEGQTAVFCYDCHEELLHNPVFLPADIARFAGLTRARSLHEVSKGLSRDKIAGRIKLLHEVVDRGLAALEKE